MRLRLAVPVSLMLAFSLACGSDEPEVVVAPAEAPVAAAPAAAAEDIKPFLASTEGTYGWETAGGKLSYDFFPDGRVHIQGPDGEATMWEGTWELSGDKLTVKEATLPTETFTVRRDGEKLLLNGAPWTRYQP